MRPMPEIKRDIAIVWKRARRRDFQRETQHGPARALFVYCSSDDARGESLILIEVRASHE